MANRNAQILKQKSILTRRQLALQLQRLVIAPPDKFEEHILEELSRNPALKIEEERVRPLDERQQEIPDGFNAEFVKRYDEWETGDRADQLLAQEREFTEGDAVLEKIVEEEYGEDTDHLQRALNNIALLRRSGRTSQDTVPNVRHALRKLRERQSASVRRQKATFCVEVFNDRVTAVVVSSLGERLRVRTDIAGFETAAQRFLEHVRIRRLILDGIARHILEDIQSDYFRHANLTQALLALLPLPAVEVRKLGFHPNVELNDAYLSKLGKLLVRSSLGSFPLSLFWQEKAAVLRIWVRAAIDAGAEKPREIADWIRPLLQKRKADWPLSDRRHQFFDPLLRINDIEIGNSLKQIRK